ncbi:sulfite exporter TauE/SafE family protein, partial [Microvirga sp. 3-52]|nr:sulfite exporter TauE/SafE family protein [Microvirga sp. 3-52]
MLGASFSLAFCPTMFVLFFLWLMPLVVTTSYGFVLPAVFGVATSLPLIVLFFFIWFFDAKRIIMKRSIKTGRIVQRLAGALLIIIGIADTITFW